MPSPTSATLEPHLVEQRGLYHGNTPLVLRPGSVADVSAILKLANDTRTADRAAGRQYRLVGGRSRITAKISLADALEQESARSMPPPTP
jgi:FAD/FMN-containing dehydrogenase